MKEEITKILIERGYPKKNRRHRLPVIYRKWIICFKQLFNVG